MTDLEKPIEEHSSEYTAQKRETYHINFSKLSSRSYLNRKVKDNRG